MAIDPVISTNKIAPATSQLFNPASNGAPSSVGLQDSIANGSAFQNLLGLGNSGSLLNPLQSLDAGLDKHHRKALKVAKKDSPRPGELLEVLAEKSSLAVNLSVTTKLLGQATKALTSLTNQQ